MTIATSADTGDLATTDKADQTAALWVCWIDTNVGYFPPDWEMDSFPKTQVEAEQESRECWALGFPALILPDGQTPRRDGLFSNPATDPVNNG